MEYVIILNHLSYYICKYASRIRRIFLGIVMAPFWHGSGVLQLLPRSRAKQPLKTPPYKELGGARAVKIWLLSSSYKLNINYYKTVIEPILVKHFFQNNFSHNRGVAPQKELKPF